MDRLDVQPADVRDCAFNPAQDAIVRAAVAGEVLLVRHDPNTGASWLANFLRDRCGWICAPTDGGRPKITDEFARGQDVVVDIDCGELVLLTDIQAVPREIVMCFAPPPAGAWRELDVTKITRRQGWSPVARICACGGRRWFSDGLCATERVHGWRAFNQ
jgi:hypothetical protein